MKKLLVLSAVILLVSMPAAAQDSDSGSSSGDDPLDSPDQQQPGEPITDPPEPESKPGLLEQAGMTANAVIDTVFGGIADIFGGIADVINSLLGG